MTEKPPENNIGNNPAPKSPESELSPEILEVVMAKVQDINEEGTAFSIFANSAGANLDGLDAKAWVNIYEPRIKSVFSHGLLGGLSEGNLALAQQKKEANIHEWREKIRSQPKDKKIAPVFFNILGRTRDIQKIKDADLILAPDSDDRLTIIFDISKFREIVPPIQDNEDNKFLSSYQRPMPQPYTFWVDPKGIDEFGKLHKKYTTQEIREMMTPGSDRQKTLLEVEGLRGDTKKIIDQNKKLRPMHDYGFVLPYRIPQRLFMGLVINMTRRETEGEAKRRGTYYPIPYIRFPIENMNFKIERANLIASTIRKTVEDHPDYLIPIYDLEGNLLWPKQMSYEEVKKFVEERDKNKTEQNKEQKDEK